MQASMKQYHTHFRAADDIQATIIFRLAWQIPDSITDATVVYNKEVDEIFQLMGNTMNFLFSFGGWFVFKNNLVTG